MAFSSRQFSHIFLEMLLIFGPLSEEDGTSCIASSTSSVFLCGLLSFDINVNVAHFVNSYFVYYYYLLYFLLFNGEKSLFENMVLVWCPFLNAFSNVFHLKCSLKCHKTQKLFN